MCGIAGVFDQYGRDRIPDGIAERMLGEILHRGPDEVSVHRQPNYTVAFARLSIVDPLHGQQPMFSEDRTVVSVCNGEIYNYRELGQQLVGHDLRTQSDAECIPHLYEQEGIDLLERIEGQFAVALFDSRRQQLLLARDRVGVVPLHYCLVEGQLVFASEIKAILVHPSVSRAVDPVGLDQLFVFPGLVSPRTMFAGIKSLSSGHLLIAAPRGVTIKEYWDLHYPTSEEPQQAREPEEHVERLAHALRTAVSRRLQGEAPIGAYVSGGLDSSLIAAMALVVTGSRTLPTFGIDVIDPRLSERAAQDATARALGLNHTSVPHTVNDIVNNLSRAVWHSECALKESYNTASLALSSTARSAGVKVIVAGEGADELFAGYVGYRFDAIANTRPVKSVAQAEATARSMLWGDSTFRYERDYARFTAELHHLYSASMRDRLGRWGCLEYPVLNPDRLAGRHPLHKRSYADFKLRLADHLLSDHGDRMALANSVECRYPFLDEEVIAVARALPPNLNLADGREKYLVRSVAANYLPDFILRREKFGFATPGSPAVLRADSQGYLHHLVSPNRLRRGGYFDPDLVGRLVHDSTRSGFDLLVPFEDDPLMVILTFELARDLFHLPDLN
jgi:asparagine synthase (glutamine-hydrolysing)